MATMEEMKNALAFDVMFPLSAEEWLRLASWMNNNRNAVEACKTWRELRALIHDAKPRIRWAMDSHLETVAKDKGIKLPGKP